ncbi:MAG TPA: hypothetical protein VHH36_05575 [Candidatus Thermoplasmatota archaeon]|nr:hypothetical protein [Candidatus Thermoplasmatota archaeon]
MKPVRAAAVAVAALLLSAAPALADEDERERGKGRGPSVAIGEFAVAGGQARGEFVSFDYNASGLGAFTADGVRLFDLAVEGGLPHLAEARVQHAQLRLEAEGFRLVVHDNPAAVTRIDSDRAVSLTFVDGTQLSVSREGEQVTFAVGDLAGKVRGDDVRLEGRTVRAEGLILFLLDSGRSSAFESSRPHIVSAIERGHVGVEASFGRGASAVEQDVVSYGNVTLTTLRAERGNLTVQVEGHGFSGRVIVLNVDGRVLGAAEADKLDVKFDHEPIAQADDLVDALDPDNDGLKAEYYLVFDPMQEAFQLVVSVPHYSVHTLSIASIVPLPPPSVVVGVLAGVALLVPSALVLFRRK